GLVPCRPRADDEPPGRGHGGGSRSGAADVTPPPFAEIGVGDLMIGFPRAEAARPYDFLAPQLRDRSAETAEFPAGFLFKDVPNRLDQDLDPVDVTLAEMDRHG